jgi:antitoxin (DNA-binding transcriptional repressor) of toxin-antitoxin stability system
LKSVGIRELKRGISGYLRDVRAGEKVLIMDRKKQLAIITSVEGGQECDCLRSLVEKGIVYWSESKPGKDVPRVRSRKSVSDAALEDRR